MWEGFWLRNCKENMRFAKHQRWNLEHFVSLDLELISRVLQSYIGTSHCHLVENITSIMVCIQLLKLKPSVAAKPQRKPLYENTTYLKNTNVSIIWNSELEGYPFSAENFQDLFSSFNCRSGNSQVSASTADDPTTSLASTEVLCFEVL